MIRKTTIGLGLAAACLMGLAAVPAAQAAPDQVWTNGPQVDAGDVSPNWSPRQDVIESRRYNRLLASNPAFRAYRMRKECGPITDPTLHARCLASFNTGAGLSASAHSYRTGSGHRTP